MRKTVFLFIMAIFLVDICGCAALIVGTAAGAGTAVWLSEKLTQEFNSPYERTIVAAKKALLSLNLKITKESKEATVTQLKSEYTDGKDIWIDIRRVTENSTKVEIRVGAVSPDKEAATKILKRIQRYL